MVSAGTNYATVEVMFRDYILLDIERLVPPNER